MQKNQTILLSTLLSLLVSGMAQADVFQFEASLSGPAEFPPVPSPGTGSALVTYDNVAHTLLVSAEFMDLLAPTTVAHIHAPTAVPFDGTVSVATYPSTFPGFPAGVTAGTYDSPVIDLTQTTSFTGGFLAANGGTAGGAETGLFKALRNGKAYFNIHTTLHQSGEIRGFLTPVPDSSATTPLLALALLAIAGFTRYQRVVAA
ncbi:MAG: CHRD domain-containing protein [Verrucomicrobiales bacterium]|nr:CHRD domain-containing protein [Verrucomicrobiales bacterium]